MGKNNKVFTDILAGRKDQTIRFTELTTLLLAMGFNERINGSHHIYYRQDSEEILNLQAKSYQVKQVRNIILK